MLDAMERVSGPFEFQKWITNDDGIEWSLWVNSEGQVRELSLKGILDYSCGRAMEFTDRVPSFSNHELARAAAAAPKDLKIAVAKLIVG